MKRLWVNRIDYGSSHKRLCINFCAICKNFLNKQCALCQSQIPKNNVNEHRQFMKYIWTFLLTEQRRPGSPFNILDINVISKLYKHCITGDYKKNDCSIVTLECNHIFHRHCFEQWIHKRLTCPLCSWQIIMPIKIDISERLGCNGTLTKVFSTKYTLQQIYDREDDKINVQAVVCQTVKHHKPGYDYDTLCNIARKKHIRAIDKDIFDFALSKLIRKQYIELINNKHVYIP